MIVAALYIDPGGPYPKMADVDCWDEARDARNYRGAGPVVCHPPCAPWSKLQHLASDKLIGERPLAMLAVWQVRTFGGVLEHPAGSKLWEACGLPAPGRCKRCTDGRGQVHVGVELPCWCTCHGDHFGGYTIELDQCEWGHVARKRTWLYLVGVPREALEAPPYPGRKPTKSVSGRRGAPTQAKHPNWREQLPRCSDSERRRTPPEFAAYLVSLARAAGEARRAA